MDLEMDVFDSQSSSQIAAAVSRLHQGEAVVFPTDTVYGIGVAVNEHSSPDVIYQLKGRDTDKAIPWLIADARELDRYARNVPAYAYNLIDEYWPGALTLICEANDAAPPAFCAEDNSIALRMPDSRIALELIKQLGSPLATSSANLQGELPATSIDTLDSRLIREDIMLIDGGPTPGPIPSTIVSCLGEEPVIVRDGVIKGSDVYNECHPYES